MSSSQILIFTITIAMVMIFRFRKIISGGPVSKNRIILTSAFYFVISILTVISSFQAGVSVWYVFVYAGMLIGATCISNRFVGKTVMVWKADDGRIHANGGNIPYVIWLVGLVLRFILGYLFIGPDYFMTVYGAQKTLDTFAVEVILIIDLIMMLGVGALTGRNLRVICKLKTFQ